MIVDTSAVVAIATGEPESVAFTALLKERASAMSAATLLETEIVLRSKRGERGVVEVRNLLVHTDTAIVPMDESLVRTASAAHRRFGRGSGSPAELNYGDCFSYALAVERGEPLLYKGDDFIHTDVRSALPR